MQFYKKKKQTQTNKQKNPTTIHLIWPELTVKTILPDFVVKSESKPH